MTTAVIVDAVRTASGKGKPGGALSATHPVDLFAGTLRALVERNDLDPALVEDVIAGCVSQAGDQSLNIARNAVLAAGFPEGVPATTVDRQCGSSQQAAHFAAQGVIAGAYDIVIAGGVESMSRVPMGFAARGGNPFGDLLGKRYPEGLIPQGYSAELIAARWNLDREALDRFSARSHRLAAQAAATARSIARSCRSRSRAASTGSTRRSARPPPRKGSPGSSPPSSTRAWARASRRSTGGSRPAIRPPHRRRVRRADHERGAGERARPHAAGPLPRVRGHRRRPAADADRRHPGHPQGSGAGGLGIDDIDAFEVNEAFAPVPLAWAADVGADLDKVNRRGGAIAIGHPLGASGGRLLSTLLGVLESTGGRYGLQTMCEGGGMANAMIIERL